MEKLKHGPTHTKTQGERNEFGVGEVQIHAHARVLTREERERENVSEEVSCTI